MTRVKKGVNALKNRRNVLKQVKGYRHGRGTKERQANEAIFHAGTYAFAHRRDKKGDFRRLWIQRINAASRQNGLTYNRFIQGLDLAGIEVDRRILAELAVNEPATFAAIVQTAKKALPADTSAPKVPQA